MEDNYMELGMESTTISKSSFEVKVDLLLMAATFLDKLNHLESTTNSTSSSNVSTIFASPSPTESESEPNDIYETKTSSTKCNDAFLTCQICGDKATGIHYHAIACEGCKGFFRRSIRKNILYKCYKNKTCIVNKTTRNRCQACRLNKCLCLGMSPSAVRPDRISRPSQNKTVASTNYDNARILADSIVGSHTKTFSPTIRSSRKASNKQNDDNKGHIWDNESDFSKEATQKIVNFANGIPAFDSLNHEDKQLLLDQGLIEIMILRASTRYSPDKDCLILPNEKYVSLTETEDHIGGLADSIRQLAKTLSDLELNATELALFEAILLFSPDRFDCEEICRVYDLFDSVRNVLRSTMKERRQGRTSAFTRLFKAYCHLRCKTYALHEKERQEKGGKERK